MGDTTEPKPSRNRDQELPPHRGERIDESDDKKRERDKVPDTPPTEPEPMPVREPPPPPEKRGPFIARHES